MAMYVHDYLTDASRPLEKNTSGALKQATHTSCVRPFSLQEPGIIFDPYAYPMPTRYTQPGPVSCLPLEWKTLCSILTVIDRRCGAVDMFP